MWVERTPEDVVKWRRATEKEGRFSGILFAGGVYLGISILLAGGWFVGRHAVWVERDQSENFWTRLPIILLIGLPVAIWLFKREKARGIERCSQMTTCPKCDTAAEGNAGSPCDCGGSFVLQSTVKWIDEEEVPEPGTSLGKP